MRVHTCMGKTAKIAGADQDFIPLFFLYIYKKEGHIKTASGCATVQLPFDPTVTKSALMPPIFKWKHELNRRTQENGPKQPAPSWLK